MERGGICPDIITYNSLIYCYCWEGRMREALRLHKESKGAILTKSHTLLLLMECRANDLDEALLLRDALEAKRLYPGIVTQKYEVCLKVRTKMLEAGLKLDSFTLKALIHRILQSSRCNITPSLFDSHLVDDSVMERIEQLESKMEALTSTSDLVALVADVGVLKRYSYYFDGRNEYDEEVYDLPCPGCCFIEKEKKLEARWEW
ncbi:hypothetical protein M9H77_26938 [Catharanthus roseus]|uniref:Uncharacterized protein n=1 Tax=Catharanthus roseus TaxID=4058 RepID=A0ACC0ACZ3_CATRO|nr:hypothetical protein M9H77_26938 [Catharanthus roseus]